MSNIKHPILEVVDGKILRYDAKLKEKYKFNSILDIENCVYYLSAKTKNKSKIEYIGSTKNLKNRLRAHVQKINMKSFEQIYHENFNDAYVIDIDILDIEKDDIIRYKKEHATIFRRAKEITEKTLGKTLTNDMFYKKQKTYRKIWSQVLLNTTIALPSTYKIG